jgi:hypothetical protein
VAQIVQRAGRTTNANHEPIVLDPGPRLFTGISLVSAVSPDSGRGFDRTINDLVWGSRTTAKAISTQDSLA